MAVIPHVLWIGGPSGSGKTTTARRLARRNGLRWYNSDARTWEHRDRALAAGNPAATRFEEWRGQDPEARSALTYDEKVAMALHRERGPMVVDDVRALPPSPLTVAEGTLVTPRVMGTEPHAVWLIPPAEIRSARLAARPYTSDDIEFALRNGRRLEQEVRETGARKLVPDPRATVDEIVAQIEEIFADILAKGPCATTREERRAMLRFGNAAIVTQHLTAFARPWSNVDARTAIRPFDCECGDPGCDAMVELAIADFPSQSDPGSPAVLAPGHGEDHTTDELVGGRLGRP